MTNARRLSRLPLCLLAVSALLLMHRATPIALAQDGAHGTAATGPAAPASAIHAPGPAVRAPRTTQRYTAPGMTLNPVAIDFDPQGNLYVVEGWRMGKGAAAIVHGPMVRSNSLPLDLQRTTIEQRAEHIESLIEGGYFEREYFTGRADKLRLVKDTDGDGIADHSSIFADGFNDKLDGVASGVLWHKGRLFFACVPHLWVLEDKDGDGDADKQTPGERTSLSYGYGLRWGYGGHDLHGLIKGPDGRIYFTMGDRGYNIQTQEGERLIGTDVGSVFRMWPDGSGLEVFATGLRNPQELAFDNYGNLFTGENNCDAGDLARFCFVPEGSDAGWRQDVQSLRSRGPWLREHMWEPRFEKNDPAQPAWIMPPLANVGRGPSGIAHYPGTGDVFPTHGSFLMCDYPAGVRHVRVEPDGASFKVVEDSQLPTEGNSISDVAWGYDGRLYLADWGGGWGPNDKHGHVKVMVNEQAHQEQAAVIAEVEQLFAEGFEKLSDDQLIELLGHEDQRVRIHAQWEAASRIDGQDLVEVMLDEQATELQRLHALWAVGMLLAQGEVEHLPFISDLLETPNDILRANAFTVLGEAPEEIDVAYHVAAFKRERSPRVLSRAAIGLSKSKSTEVIPALFDLLHRNDNNDVVLRHAASYGLSLIGDAEAIHKEMKRRGSAARLGGVLALRHLKSPLLVEYIEDEDLQVAAEAVRAIYDQKVDEHLPSLAALADTLSPDRMIEPIMRRVIEANVRLADADSANRLAKIAATASAPERWRALALKELTDWSAPRDREDVWGWWLPRPEQTMAHASAAMKTHLPAIKQTATGSSLTAARVFELTHILKADKDQLTDLASDPQEPDAVRLAGLGMLEQRDRRAAVELAEQLLAQDGNTLSLRSTLRETLNRLDWSAGLAAYLDAVENGATPEQQEAITKLAPNRSGQAQQKMAELGEQLKAGTLAPELRLDAYLALTRYNNLPPAAMQAARDYARQHSAPGEGPHLRDAALAGGSVQRGREVFLYHSAAQCVRCHGDPAKPDASMVGPWLGAVGAMYDADALYDALIHPSKTIAEGYASSTVFLNSGQSRSGRLLNAKSSGDTLVLANSDGIEQRIDRGEVASVVTAEGVSQMPRMADTLSPRELRDVLAYLDSLRADPASALGSGSQARAVKRASGLPHAVWLPAILIAIAGGLGLILIATLLSGSFAAASGHD